MRQQPHGVDPSRCPLVSVIIPTYNRADLLPAAIESVLGQSYPNTEVIVIDDGSTDHTQDVLRQYSGKINAEYQENNGASAARNHGIRKANGEIIAFLDSDDLWLPTKLERQVDLLQNTNPADTPCCLCNIKLAYADGRTGSSFELSLIKPSTPEGIWTNALDVLSTRFILFNQAIAVRKEALLKVGCFDESCKFMEDHDLALRLALLGSWAYTQEPLVVWNEGTVGSLTSQAQKQKVNVTDTMLKIYQKINLLAEESLSSDRTRSHVRFELNRNHLRFTACKLRHSINFWSKACGYMIEKSERYFDKLYTHSPWYPKMETLPITHKATIIRNIK
ncbi:hypothetical protein MCAMS1_01299 [biofilm metagenome]